MEKLAIISSSQRPAGNHTAEALLIRPFSQITIQRPLRHFDKALALTPGVAGEPSPEILTRILTGYNSHQAVLRQHLGDANFRNFENLVRRKNEPTPKTLNLLSGLFDSSPEEIRTWIHGQKQGPVMPLYLQLMQRVEGFTSMLYEKATAGIIPCPCCGKNILNSTDAFWHGQESICLNEPEYLFVERCLAALMGWRFLRLSVRSLLGMHDHSSHSRCFSPLNSDPLDPEQYPVGNWLKAVRVEFRCSDNLELEKRLASLPSDRSPVHPVIQSRLNKWACGDDPIDLEVGQSIAQTLHNSSDLKYGLIEANVIAFLQEFIGAAAIGSRSPRKEDVRLILYQRAEQFASNVRMKMAHVEKSK